MKSGDTRLLSYQDTRRVHQFARFLLWVSKKKPLVRVGFPRSSVVALSPDIEPMAASKTASATPDASSTTSSTLSACTPCNASGASARAVRAEMKHSFGAAFSLRTQDNARIIQHFRFPRAVSAACQQYLAYFTQFLADLGIEADAE